MARVNRARLLALVGSSTLLAPACAGRSSDAVGAPPRAATFAIPTTDAEAKELAAKFGVEVTNADPAFPSSKVFAPREPGTLPGIVLLHGSGPEGGALTWFPAARLAQRGFVTFALSYSGAPGTPPHLLRVALEHTVRAARWLAAHARVNASKVALVGWSRGAELALLVATETAAPVSAVAAFAPTSVVYAAWDPVNEEALRERDGSYAPAWTLRGEPIAAHTPVRGDRFAGPVLLVAGGKDDVWPSADAARELAAQRERVGRTSEVLLFAEEGHFLSWDASSVAMDRTTALVRDAIR